MVRLFSCAHAGVVQEARFLLIKRICFCFFLALAREYAGPMLLRMTGLSGINFRHDIDVVASWNCKKAY